MKWVERGFTHEHKYELSHFKIPNGEKMWNVQVWDRETKVHDLRLSRIFESMHEAHLYIKGLYEIG